MNSSFYVQTALLDARNARDVGDATTRGKHQHQSHSPRQDRGKSKHSSRRSPPQSTRRDPSVKSASKAKAKASSSRSANPRVVFGRGTFAQIPDELARLNVHAPLIVSSPSRVALAKSLQALIPDLNSRILDSSLVNVPARVVSDSIARITDRDCVISVGSGSAVDLARFISVAKGIPHICVPTTYSGSETATTASSYAAGGRDARRGTSRESRPPPAVVIYDEDLTTATSTTMSVPPRLLAPSGTSTLARSISVVSSRIPRTHTQVF